MPVASITQSNVEQLVTIFGGSGFLGRHVVRALCKHGYRIRVAVRRPDLAFHLQPLGRVGQVHAVQANLRYPGSVQAAARGADVVINLVGILFERGRQRFKAIHAEGAGLVAEAANYAGARIIHVSAIGADPNSKALYARTKALGEQAVRTAAPTATIFRPSIVFGPEDDFFNRFAAMARLSPALPLIGGGRTQFQPVFVGDVAQAITRVVDGQAQEGRLYELGGPDVWTFRELMEFILAVTERRRALLSVPFAIAELAAWFEQFLPKPQLTPDQVRMLKTDNIVSSDAIREGRTLSGLGIEPHSIATIVPSYLWRFRKTGQFRPPALSEGDRSGTIRNM
jgi:NADH dehydrogenase